MSDISVREFESELEDKPIGYDVDLFDNISPCFEKYLKEDDLSNALKAGAMLIEQAFNSKTYKFNYRGINSHICKKLEFLSDWLHKAHSARRISLLNVYEVVQCFENPLSRLYLMITVSFVFVRIIAEHTKEDLEDNDSKHACCNIKEESSDYHNFYKSFSKEFLVSLVEDVTEPRMPEYTLSIEPGPLAHPQLVGVPKLESLLSDVALMCSAVQDPITGICLRHYLAHIAVIYVRSLPEIKYSRTTLLLLLRFVLKNFIESNILWIRHRNILTAMGNSRLENVYKSQKSLITFNIYVLSLLCENDVSAYKHLVLPALLREAVTCGVHYPQKCILKAILKHFKPHFHKDTFEELFMGIIQLKTEAGISDMIITLVKHLLYQDNEVPAVCDETSVIPDEKSITQSFKQSPLPFKNLWTLVLLLHSNPDHSRVDLSDKLKILFIVAKYTQTLYPDDIDNVLVILEHIFNEFINPKLSSSYFNREDNIHYHVVTPSIPEIVPLECLNGQSGTTLCSLLLLFLDGSSTLTQAFMPHPVFSYTTSNGGTHIPPARQRYFFDIYITLCATLRLQLRELLYFKLFSAIIRMHFLYGFVLTPEELFETGFRGINNHLYKDSSYDTYTKLERSLSHDILQKIEYASPHNTPLSQRENQSLNDNSQGIEHSYSHDIGSSNDDCSSLRDPHKRASASSSIIDSPSPKLFVSSLDESFPSTIAMLVHVTSPKRNHPDDLISFIEELSKLSHKSASIHPQVSEALALRAMKLIEVYVSEDGIDVAQEVIVNKLLHSLLLYLKSLPYSRNASPSLMSSIAIRLLCEAALLADKCKNEPFTYKCIIDAISLIPPPNIPIDEQQPALGAYSLAYLMRVLFKITVLNKEDYRNIAISCALSSAKLYDRIDRCSCLVIASHLFQREHKHFIFQDNKLLKQCLGKALDISSTIVFTNCSRELFSKILQTYIYYHRKNPRLIPVSKICQITRRFRHLTSAYRPSFRLVSESETIDPNYTPSEFSNIGDIHAINGLLPLAEKLANNTEQFADTNSDDGLHDEKNTDDESTSFNIFLDRPERDSTPTVTLKIPDVSNPELSSDVEDITSTFINYASIENLPDVWGGKEEEPQS